MDFLPRTLLYYILSHTYLFWSFYRLSGRRRMFLAVLPFFATLGLFPYVYHLLPPGGLRDAFAWTGAFWLPVAFFCLMVFAVADLLSLLAWGLRHIFPRGALFFFSRRRLLALLLLIGACLYGYGVYEAHTPRVSRIVLETDALPPGTEPVRIVFASDLHIGPQTGPGMLRAIVSLILEQRPDCILLGGDLLDDSFQGTPADMEELARLRAPLGAYAVLGNHDAFGGYKNAVATLARSGLTLLSDQTVATGPLRIVGIDDPLVTEQKGATPPDVAALLRQTPRDRYTVLLDHRPVLRENTVGLFDLQLSGHSHGGQIIMLRPLLESKYGSPTGLSVHHSSGGTSFLFVTTGTGYSKLPIRLLVPPEIVVIDIRRSGNEERSQ